MNKDDIKKRIEYIEERRKTLKKAIGEYEKLNGFEKYKCLKTIERDSEEIIESAVRINQDILEEKETIAETYRESFEKVSDILKIDENTKEKLANSTGFRNRLAHDYMYLNEKATMKSAKIILTLYPVYLLKIIKYIENN